MVKTYLRYRQDAVLGVVASSGGAIDVSSEPDAAGNVLLFTPQLERLGMWSLGRGVQLHSFDAGGTGASGAAASVTCTRASPGTAPTVAAGYDDGAVRTFDCVKLAPRAVFHGHKKAVSALCYSPDGQLLASGSRDTSIVLWDLLAETGVCRFRGHRDEVTSVAFVSLHGGSSAGGRGRLLLVSGSKDTLVKVWDLSVRSCLQTIVGARTEVWSLAVTPQHDRLLVGTSDQQLLVWRVGDEAGAAKTAAAGDGAKDGAAPPAAASTAVFHPMGSVARQTHDRVASVRCSADGAHAGIQCAGKSIEVLRRRTPAEAAKRLQRRLRRHREKLGKKSRKAAADAGGSDDDDGGAESLDLVGTSLADIDALLAQLDGGDAAATGPRGGDGAKAGPVDWVVASDEWELVGVVQAAQRVSAFAFLPPPGRVSASVAVAGGAAPPLQLAVALHSNVVEVHSLVPLEPDAPPPAPGSLHVATTAAGVTVAQSSVLRTIGGLQGHRADVRAVAVSPDGSLLLSVAGAQARVWNAKSGACIRTLSLGEASAVGLCAAFAPGARHALIGLKTGRLLVFDLASTDLIESHDAHTAALWSVAVRPDGRGCATGGADKEVKFWDFDLTAAAPVGAGVAGGTAKPAAAASGGAKQLTLVHTRTLKLTDEVLTVRYSHHADPAQLLLAAALLDATVRVFFDDTLKFFLSLYGHKLPVLTMDISADSTLLITGSADKNVKIWGLDFGDCHKSFLAHGDSVMAVAFLSRTHYFFSAGKDRAIKYWDADRFEHILTLEGHKGEVWGLAAAPDGAFVVSASHDRSLRVWVRTDEQVFLDEEREREFDGLLARQLRDADDGAEAAALGGEDAVGPVGPGGLAVPTGMDAVPTAEPLAGAAAAGDATTAVVARASHDSMQASDRLLEAIAMAVEEEARWAEYADDYAAAVAAGEADASRVVATPARNARLLGLTPAAYLLRVLRGVRPADIDQVLLVTAFPDAIALLRYLRHWLASGQATELFVRCTLLLLRVHHRALVANHTLRPLLGGLRSALRARVGELRDAVGVNVAGLRFVEAALAGEEAPPLLADVRGGGAGDDAGGVRIGKRRRVKLF